MHPLRPLTFSVLILAGFVLPAYVVNTPRNKSPNARDDIPAWVHEHLSMMIGRWVADNATYQSEEEPYEAYGIEWSWGLGEKSVTGRLFGLQDGQETGAFWEFRVFWHPGEQHLKLYQFGGNGTVGVGAIDVIDEHKTEALQTFYNPDGTQTQIGHREERTEGVNHSHSFNVNEDGVWTPRRSYVWHRQER